VTKLAWVRDIDSFYNFIGYVVLRAPNRFPVEDYLAADEQMTLDRAFVELRKGLAMVDPEVADAQKREKLASLLDASLAAYRAGDDIKGAHLLHDFEGLIFKA
jgi:hypothetical protein